MTTKSVTLTVDPGTCLHGGQVVTVSATGATPNSPGGVSQCNMAVGAPTIAVQGNPVPVGCTNPLFVFGNVGADGTMTAKLTVIAGITGPPDKGTDSTGGSSMIDALAYPCPPTAAQAASGLQCTISFGNASGDQVTVPISFAPNTPLTTKKAGTTLF